MEKAEVKGFKLLARDPLLGFGSVGEGVSLQVTGDGRRILWLAHEGPPKNFTGVDVTDPRKPKTIVQTELAQQETALERARSELREAERVLQALSAQLKQQEAALRTHRSHSTEASAAARDAERALASAHAELADLTAPK